MILSKIINSLKRIGIVETIKKSLNYPFILYKRKKFRKKLENLNTTEDKFIWIYRNNYWDNDETYRSCS